MSESSSLSVEMLVIVAVALGAAYYLITTDSDALQEYIGMIF